MLAERCSQRGQRCIAAAALCCSALMINAIDFCRSKHNARVMFKICDISAGLEAAASVAERR